MRIIFLQRFTPKSAYGGAEVSAWHIARGLVRLGHQVEIFCEGERYNKNNNPSLSARLKTYKKNKIMVHPIPGLFGRNVLTLEKLWAKKQAKILKKYLPKKFDILHSHDQHSLLINAELNTNTKQFHTVRDYTPICGYNHLKIDNSICHKCSLQNFKTCPKIIYGNLLQKPLRVLRFLTTIPYHQQCLSKLDGVIFISHFLKQEILKSSNWRNKIPKPVHTTVIYNPVPEWGADELHFQNSSLKQSTNTNLLFVGRLEKHKGLSILLKAFRKLNKNFNLVIIGQGNLEYYKNFAKKLKLDPQHLQFLGQVPHHLMPDIYKKSDILISPHLWPEPFGRTIIEAMFFGKIVIASDLGGPREIIQSGVNGFLVPSGDPSALRKKIMEIAQDINLQEQIKKQAVHTVLHRFTPRKIAENYLEFYQKS